MKRVRPSIAAAALVALLLAGILYFVLEAAGRGEFGELVRAGRPSEAAATTNPVASRIARQARVADRLDRHAPKQILFGDLHVHSSFSADAFQLTLPTSGGEGLHPVADACDFARFCAGLDFWSINDHANSLTARRWRETIESVRRCEEIAAGGVGREPDLISFLGWEWTQMGSTPDNHYGHKNVILRDLAEDAIPARPIAAAPPPGVPSSFDTGQREGLASRLALGFGAFAIERGHDLMRQIDEITSMERCPLDVPVRDLPPDCTEAVETPGELFAKLDEWGHAATVIPHGTVWGMYTPAGSSWAKQLDPAQHDPARQRLIEVYSGHGNAEEFRDWKATDIDADGGRHCPEPRRDYTPACWQAGEVIRDRCLSEDGGPSGIDRAPAREAECDARAARARAHFVAADRNAGPWTIPGLEPHALLDAGQCRDCFQPAFNYRPLSSVQAILALGRPSQTAGARRFRFGFIASSDNHTARAGTGYKETARREFTDARMGEVGRSTLATVHRREPSAHSEAFTKENRTPSVAFLETERGGSFFLTGGLAAVHTSERDRHGVFAALERRETYATSGPRILLWFDLLDPDSPTGRWPMGSERSVAGTPTFRVSAAGSFEQKPGCPDATRESLGPERIESLCLGECYFPSDRRRPITRIEVVRIRTQPEASHPLAPLIEDPWKTIACSGDPGGCQVVFSDPEFATAGRTTSYYVRAIEAASPTVAADPLGCGAGAPRDDAARCLVPRPCLDRPDDDDCLSPSEHRAWSSPIFLDPRSPEVREAAADESRETIRYARDRRTG